MLFILANDAHLARMWAETHDIPDTEWSSATPGSLKAFPSHDHGDHGLVILEGAEMSPQYSLILDLARDRGIKVSSASIHGDEPAAASEDGAD